ncbi:MAG: aminotransferase class IV [Bdellovibrionota bacterium]
MKNQAGSVFVLKQLYKVSQNGQMVRTNPEHFRLHDSAISFNQRPRVFTTFVARKQHGHASVIGLNHHLARLEADAKRFAIRIPQVCLRDAIRESIAELGALRGAEESLRARVVLSDNTVELFTDVFERRYAPGTAISVCGFEKERAYPDSKTTLTEASLAAHAAASARGCQEALLVDGHGFVSEGAWSNLFWVDPAGALCRANGPALPGVTAALVSASREVESRTVTVSELLCAQEVLMTQSTHGITPVGSVDGQAIGNGSPGLLTHAIADWYESLSEAEENRLL